MTGQAVGTVGANLEFVGAHHPGLTPAVASETDLTASDGFIQQLQIPALS